MYLGRLEPEKGVDVLLRAWAIIERDLHYPELVIAGDGSMGTELRNTAAAMGLSNIHFTGRYEREDLDAMFDQVAVSVHPSVWFENSPFTVRESLLRAVPAIVTNVGGMPEMVGLHSGSIIEAGSPEALARAIREELEQPRAGSALLVEEVGRRAMSDSSHLEGLLEIYETALSGKADHGSERS